MRLQPLVALPFIATGACGKAEPVPQAAGLAPRILGSEVGSLVATGGDDAVSLGSSVVHLNSGGFASGATNWPRADIALGAVAFFSRDLEGTQARVLAGGPNLPGIMGWRIGAAGDVDGDGLDDIVGGDPNWDEVNGEYQPGTLGLLSGVDLQAEVASQPIWLDTFESEPGDELGFSLDATATDSGPLIVAGAPYYWYYGDAFAPGTAHVLTVEDHALEPIAQVDGVTDSDQLGWDVATVGDVDGDGSTDLFLGIPGSDRGGALKGEACLWLGPQSGLLTADELDGCVLGGVHSGQLGWTVGGGADFDGDGLDDVAVSSVSGFADPEHEVHAEEVTLYPGWTGTISADGAMTTIRSTLEEVWAFDTIEVFPAESDGSGAGLVLGSMFGGEHAEGEVRVFRPVEAGVQGVEAAQLYIQGPEQGGRVGSSLDVAEVDGSLSLLIGCSSLSTDDPAVGAVYEVNLDEELP